MEDAPYSSHFIGSQPDTSTCFLVIHSGWKHQPNHEPFPHVGIPLHMPFQLIAYPYYENDRYVFRDWTDPTEFAYMLSHTERELKPVSYQSVRHTSHYIPTKPPGRRIRTMYVPQSVSSPWNDIPSGFYEIQRIYMWFPIEDTNTDTVSLPAIRRIRIRHTYDLQRDPDNETKDTTVCECVLATITHLRISRVCYVEWFPVQTPMPTVFRLGSEKKPSVIVPDSQFRMLSARPGCQWRMMWTYSVSTSS